MVDEADILRRYDITERNSILLFINDTGHKAVGFRQQVKGIGFARGIVGLTDIGNFLQVFIVPLNRIEMVEGYAGVKILT